MPALRGSRGIATRPCRLTDFYLIYKHYGVGVRERFLLHFSSTFYRQCLYLLFALAYAFVLLTLVFGRGYWIEPEAQQQLAADQGALATQSRGERESASRP